MCQLIAKKPGKTIPRGALKFCWKKNSDGAGFAYVDNGKVILVKGFMKDFDAFYDAYKLHEDKQMLIHFRLATHGKRCEGNCHPFKIIEGMVVGHNGMLTQWAPFTNDWRSDTHIFADYCRQIVQMFTETSQLNTAPILAKMLDPVIGGNRIVFMTASGFTFLNESLGDWSDGVWYSNGVPTKAAYCRNIPKTKWIDTIDEKGVTTISTEPDLELLDYFKELEAKEPPIVVDNEDMWEGYGYCYPHNTGGVHKHYEGSSGAPTQSSTIFNTSALNRELDLSDLSERMVGEAIGLYEEWAGGECSDDKWYWKLKLLTRHEQNVMIKIMCEEDEEEGGYDADLAAVIRKEFAIADKYPAQSASHSDKTLRNKKKEPLKYPEWLEDKYKVDPKFAGAFPHLERGFLMDSLIFSRAEAKARYPYVDTPKGKGLYVTLCDVNNGKVKGWYRIAGPTGEEKPKENMPNNIVMMLPEKTKEGGDNDAA